MKYTAYYRHVFPATTHVLSRKIDFLWDSVQWGGELLTLTSISSEIQEILKTSHQKGNKLLEAFKGFLQNKNKTK